MLGGSVRSLLEKSNERGIKLSWQRRVEIMLDAALGMAYLHSCTPPVMHRDLKCENLLLDKHGQAKVQRPSWLMSFTA